MKWLSVILLLYVIVLSAVPCTDDVACSDVNTYSSFPGDEHPPSSSEKHGNHDHSKDTCTPLCTCSCCGISLTTANLYLFDIEAPINTFSIRNVLKMDSSPLSDYLGTIWQPPQV